MGRTAAMLAKTHILRCSRHLQVLCTIYPTPPDPVGAARTNRLSQLSLCPSDPPTPGRTHVHLCSSMFFFVLAQEEMVRKSAPREDQQLFEQLVVIPPGHKELAEKLYK